MPNVNSYFCFLELTDPKCIKYAKNNTPYAFLPLTQHCGQLIVIDDTEYRIADHHISVYQDYTSFSHKSVYHHTMHLQNEQGDIYTIRTYFDAKDALKGAVSFTKRRSGDEQETIELSLDDTNKLAALASAYSLNKMQAIHMMYQNDVLARKEKFEQKITTLFNVSAIDALVIIPMYIEEAVLLERLNVGKYKIFLEQYQASFQAKQKLKMQEITQKEPIDDMLAPWMSVKVEEPAQLNQIQFEACMSVLSKHQERMASLNTAPQKVAVAINAAFLYLEKAQEASLQLLDECLYTQPNDLQQIHEALIESENACLNYLKDALVRREKDIYDNVRFIPYAQKIPEKMLAMLIKIKSTDAACWLLQHGQFSLNHIQFSFKNETPATLLEIAFNTGNIACFKALLEAGASSLLITEDGVPFAHQVFYSDKYDFISTLNDYLITSNQQQNVYKSLAKMTRMCLASSEINSEEKEKMERALPNYERPQHHITKSAAHGAHERTDLCLEIRQLTGLTEEDIHRLQATPAYQFVLDQFVDVMHGYKQCLPAKLQRATERKEQAMLRGLLGRIKNNPIYQSKPTDESIITALDEQTAILREASQLIVLNHEFDKNRSRYQNKKLPRKVKQEASELVVSRLALEKRIAKQMPLTIEESSHQALKKVELEVGYTLPSALKTKAQSSTAELLANPQLRQRMNALFTPRNQTLFAQVQKRSMDYLVTHPDENGSDDFTWEHIFAEGELSKREKAILAEYEDIMAGCASPS